jgi:ATP dependent DNA ligase domain
LTAKWWYSTASEFHTSSFCGQGNGEPVYAVFDCLFAHGKDLRNEPLAARRKILESILAAAATPGD